jgi:hypothetical protein
MLLILETAVLEILQPLISKMEVHHINQLEFLLKFKQNLQQVVVSVFLVDQLDFNPCLIRLCPQ